MFDGPRLCIGAAEHWTHHAMVAAIRHDGTDWSTGDRKIPDGFLVADQAVFWGALDIDEVPRGSDETAALADANRDTYDALWSHPVFRRLYSGPVRTAFFCNDGLMVTFEADGTNDLVDIDIPLEN